MTKAKGLPNYRKNTATVACGFTTVSNQAMEDITDPKAFYIYSVMLRYHTLLQFRATTKWLVRKLQLSEETVHKYIRILQKKGYVKKHVCQLSDTVCDVWFETLIEPRCPEHTTFTYNKHSQLTQTNALKFPEPFEVTCLEDIENYIELVSNQDTPPQTSSTKPVQPVQQEVARTETPSAQPKQSQGAQPGTRSLPKEFIRQVRRELGLTRNLSPMEIATLTFWHQKFSEDMILRAIQIAIENKPANPTFNYIDGIIRNWERSGLQTLSDVERDLIQWKTQRAHERLNRNQVPMECNMFQSFQQRSYTSEEDEAIIRAIMYA